MDRTADKEAIDRTADKEAIAQVLVTYVDSWNRHDMDAWAKLFTDDVDFVNRGGGWWRGSEENVEGHKSIHDMLVKQGQKPSVRWWLISSCHRSRERVAYARPRRLLEAG